MEEILLIVLIVFLFIYHRVTVLALKSGSQALKYTADAIGPIGEETDESTGKNLSGNLKLRDVSALSREELDAEYNWILDNKRLFSEGKLEKLKGNDGLIHFLYLYASGEYRRESIAGTGDAGEIFLTEEEISQGIPLFLQWDLRWGFETYGDDCIGISGCGPACLAMVVEGLTRDETVNPKTVADFAMKYGYYEYGTGTKWALFEDYADRYDIFCQDLGSDVVAILRALQEGNPVICSMKAGTFTSGGHFIVLTGIKDAKILLRDPNNREFSEKGWDFADFEEEIKNAWVFSF